MCAFLPKHFSIIHHGLGHRETEEDLEYIWLREQIRLVYLSTSHPLLLLYLLSFLSRRPRLCHSCLLSCFPSDETVHADQPHRCSTQDSEDIRNQRGESLPSCGQIMNIFNGAGEKKKTATQLLQEHFILPSSTCEAIIV